MDLTPASPVESASRCTSKKTRSLQTQPQKRAQPRLRVRPLPELGDIHKLFTGAELAIVLDVPESWVAAVRKAGAPFPGGRTRPEWIHDWLRVHPEFELKEYRG